MEVKSDGDTLRSGKPQNPAHYQWPDSRATVFSSIFCRQVKRFLRSSHQSQNPRAKSGFRVRNIHRKLTTAVQKKIEKGDF
jgi:hypothetical protein